MSDKSKAVKAKMAAMAKKIARRAKQREKPRKKK